MYTASHRFLHIGLVFPGVLKMRDLEPYFTQVGDWVRYSALTWLVWTDKSPAEAYSLLRQGLDIADQVLIAPLDLSQAFGSLSPWIWSWIKSKQPQAPIVTGALVEALLANRKLLPPA